MASRVHQPGAGLIDITDQQPCGDLITLTRRDAWRLRVCDGRVRFGRYPKER